MKIKIKRINKALKLPTIIDKGDWIDLYVSTYVELKAPQSGVLRERKNNFGVVTRVRDVEAEVSYIPLGVAIQIPKGFEAIVVPRSSTAKKYGILQANSMGIIDNSYCGDDDEWMFPALPIRHTGIEAGTKICQFRIQLSQKASMWQKIKWLLSSKIKLVEVERLNQKNRGGFGSTGDK